ncbi:MAG: EamA family transporter [Candidatus Methanomethylicaceae archaeon]
MLGELASLISAICWTFSAALYKIALKDTEPLIANIIRIILTSISLILICFLLNKLNELFIFSLLPLFYIILSSLIGLGLGDLIYMYSLDSIGVSRAVPISSIYPLFTILFSFLFFNERISLIVFIGALIIVLGIWILYKGEKTNYSSNKKGYFAAILCAILWGLSISLMGEALKFLDSLIVNTLRTIVLSIFFIFLMIFNNIRRKIFNMKFRTCFILGLAGFIALGLGWISLSIGLILIGAAKAVPISSITPLFSLIIGKMFLKEKIGINIVIGAIIIFIGVIFINLG